MVADMPPHAPPHVPPAQAAAVKAARLLCAPWPLLPVSATYRAGLRRGFRGVATPPFFLVGWGSKEVGKTSTYHKGGHHKAMGSWGIGGATRHPSDSTPETLPFGKVSLTHATRSGDTMRFRRLFRDLEVAFFFTD